MRSGELLERFGPVERLIREPPLSRPVHRHAGVARVLGQRLVAPVLAGEQPPLERQVWQRSDTEAFRCGENGVRGVPSDQVHVHLHAGERQAEPLGRRDCVLQLRDVECRQPDESDLAGADLFEEGVERLLERRLLVEEVVLVDVDPIGSESSQRFVESPADIPAGPPRHRFRS